MLDFAKLNDPETQKQIRQELDEEARLHQDKVAELQALANKCLDATAVSDKERSFLRSVRLTLAQRYSLTERQEKWLRDIASAL